MLFFSWAGELQLEVLTDHNKVHSSAFASFFFWLQIYGASWRWFENESVIDGYICEGLVSTCLTAPCARWAQKLLEGRKAVKTGPVLCRRRPAWHTLLSHTAQRREDTHRWNLFFMCSFLLTNQPLLFFSRQKEERMTSPRALRGISRVNCFSFPVSPHRGRLHSRRSNETIHVFYPSFHRSLCKVPIRFQWREE